MSDKPEFKAKDDGVWICHTCKTVIGPIWDDFENQCGCDIYDYEVSRYVPDIDQVKEIEKLKKELADLAKPSEWISCSANLPNSHEAVLVHVLGDVGKGFYDGETWRSDTYDPLYTD